MSDAPAPSFEPEEVLASWRDAHALWGTHTELSAPVAYAGEDGADGPLAYLDLVQRQVVVNYAALARLGAEKSLTAVLAHELGHHVRYPHTLAESAALEVMAARLAMPSGAPLVNLCLDLLVNERVGRTHAAALADVYRASVARLTSAPSPLFTFYLWLYEALWGLEGQLVPAEYTAPFEATYPGARGDARMFVQTFYALGDVYLQFAYFCHRVARYLSAEDARIPLSGDLPMPDADDYAGAIFGHGGIERALGEAASRGWSARAASSDPLSLTGRIGPGRGGAGAAEFRQTLASRAYRRLVDRHLFEPPLDLPRDEPSLPLGTTSWELGEDPRHIDWSASVLARGPMAVVAPLRRELAVDEDPGLERRPIDVELYLDTSGSMPNPEVGLNAMTLAAQILATATIRRGGRVRSIIYSDGFVESDWMYDEERARRTLLTYAGGGTAFPFARLEARCTEQPRVIRVIVSDSDFLWNLAQTEGAPRILGDAARRSRLLVALLWLPLELDAGARGHFGAAFAERGFRLVRVASAGDLAGAAAALARALVGPVSA